MRGSPMNARIATEWVGTCPLDHTELLVHVDRAEPGDLLSGQCPFCHGEVLLVRMATKRKEI